MAGSLVLVPTAADAAVTQNGTIDCNVEQYGGILVAPGDTAEITQSNCVAISGDLALISPAPVDGVPSATFQLSAGASVTLASENGTEVGIDVDTADRLENPEGVLLDTSEIEIAAEPAEFSVDEDEGSHFLGGQSDCAVESGEHVYATLPIVITEAGDFTFRAIATSPESQNLNEIANSYFPILDPTLAVYTEFDPSDPDADVVGCNDDRGDDGSLADGTVVDDLFPQFDAALEAGEYTLVLTTFEAIGIEGWESGETSIGEEFPAQAQSTTFQLWGAEGSLDVVVAPIITSSAPAASITVGEAFSYAVTASGTAPLTFRIASGALPAGLTLNAETGVVSGTPTTAGTSAFTVTATNAAGTATSAEYAITVAAPVPVTAPTIASVGPGEVLVDGTSLVTVIGTGFDEITTVSIDGVAASAVTFIDDTELEFTAPAHAAGQAQLTVTTAGRTSAPFTIAYIEVPVVAPTITAVDPGEVSVDGTSLVGVTGTGFDKSTTVAIDGVRVSAVAVTVIDDAELGFIAPEHAAGEAQLTVTRAGVTSAPFTLTYVAAPAPTIISIRGEVRDDGTSLVGVSGTGFDETTTVEIDGERVSAVTIINETELGFIAPAHAVGPARLTVTTAGVTSAPFTLTYVAAPVVVPDVVLVPVTPVLVPAAPVPLETVIPARPVPTERLASTGAEVTGLALLSGLTLLSGVVLSAVARRRRARTE